MDTPMSSCSTVTAANKKRDLNHLKEMENLYNKKLVEVQEAETKNMNKGHKRVRSCSF